MGGIIGLYVATALETDDDGAECAAIYAVIKTSIGTLWEKLVVRHLTSWRSPWMRRSSERLAARENDNVERIELLLELPLI